MADRTPTQPARHNQPPDCRHRKIDECANAAIDAPLPILSTFAVLRFRDQRWVGSCLTSRAGLTLTVAQRAMP